MQRGAAFLIALPLAGLLAACATPVAEPTPTPTPRPSYVAPSYIAPSDLPPSPGDTAVPSSTTGPASPADADAALAQWGLQPVPTQLALPTGRGVDVFGPQSASEAFRLFAGVSYSLNVFPELWDPAAPPPQAVLDRFTPFMTERLAKTWREKTAGFAQGTPSEALINFFPYPLDRKANGRLPMDADPNSPNATLVSPWITKASISNAKTSVYDTDDGDQGIVVQFTMTFHYVVGDESSPKWVAPVQRRFTWTLVPNKSADADPSAPAWLADAVTFGLLKRLEPYPFPENWNSVPTATPSQ